MQFYDLVTITIASGSGGDGAATGRREKHVPFGGPSGGDGGDGGSIIFEGSHNEYTLMPYKTNTIFTAKDGEDGQGSDMYGKGAEDLILKVPIGTKIYDTEKEELIGVIEEAGQQCLVAKGGKGGLGNKHFINAQKQYSTIALKGEPGQKFKVTLELQLLADVALIGAPSVGKSSLINTYTNAKAKVAEYHFTTLTPNLGIVQLEDKSFSMIDIPGLIEGAHTGKGLGYEFLRHIIKSRLLLCTADINRFENGVDELIEIIEELRLYCHNHYQNINENKTITVELVKKKEMITFLIKRNGEIIDKKALGFLINKVDLVNDQEIRNEYKTYFLNKLVDYFVNTYDISLNIDDLEQYCYFVSAATGYGKKDLLAFCYRTIQKLDSEEEKDSNRYSVHERRNIPKETIKKVTKQIRPKLLKEGYLDPNIQKLPEVWQVAHEEMAYYVYVLPWGNDEAELWFWQAVARLGIIDIFEEKGVKKGDVIQIVSPYRQHDDLFIKWE